MTLHACRWLIHAFQGHLDPETGTPFGPSEEAPEWFTWLVVIVIGVAIGLWLKNGGYPKK